MCSASARSAPASPKTELKPDLTIINKPVKGKTKANSMEILANLAVTLDRSNNLTTPCSLPLSHMALVAMLCCSHITNLIPEA